MIIDRIENIERYKYLSADLFLGLESLRELSLDIRIGEYPISDSVRIIVSEYGTRLENQGQFEAHKRAIDIQLPIIGLERVQWSSLSGMIGCSDYDVEMDRTYFVKPSNPVDCVLGDGVFAVFYPEDAHNPQLAAGKVGATIKKITVKVEINRYNDSA